MRLYLKNQKKLSLNNFLSELKELEEMEIDHFKAVVSELKEVADVIQEALEVGMTTADLANESETREMDERVETRFMDSSASSSSEKKYQSPAYKHPPVGKISTKAPSFLGDDDDDDENDKQKAWDKLAPGSFDENAEEETDSIQGRTRSIAIENRADQLSHRRKPQLLPSPVKYWW